MNSRERIAAAMEHRNPDRVPVMCQLAVGHYFLNCGRKPVDIWFDNQTFAACVVDRQKAYRFDGLLINIPGRFPDWRRFFKSSQKQAGGELLTWQDGLETFVPSDDNAHTYSPGHSPLPRADYNAVDIENPATYRIGGYIWNTWHIPALWGIESEADLGSEEAYPQWFTEPLRYARGLAGENVSVHVEVFSPFTHLMELFGYEQALFALIDAPQKCHKLLEVFTRFAGAQARVYARLKTDAILISSAFAGAGFISRAMYAEFVMPYEQLLAEEIRNKCIKSYTHTCGAIGDRLDLMAQTGIDGVDTLDPPPLGTVDLAAAKRDFGKRVFFKGNLNAVDEMLNADEQTFVNAVRQRIETGKPGGGYILSSACSVPPHVKPERLKKLVQIAEEYGKY
jgi:uroporphyrinogen-III decarboxylase